jgi:DNA-binding NarL/FixJ family response regulator
MQQLYRFTRSPAEGISLHNGGWVSMILCYNPLMTDTRTIRVLIADDFKLLCNVIRAYVERESDMEVVGEAPDLDDALALAKELNPDVILVNDYLPPLNSAHAARIFREHGIKAAILSISMDVERELIQHSLQHGITGFMHKEEIDQLLTDGIRIVHQGERYLSPRALASYGKVPE